MTDHQADARQSKSDAPEPADRFARLYTRNQQALFRYILILVGSVADANDVLQETAVALLRKIEQYDPDRPFLPWAKKFAYYEVLRHREQVRKRTPLLDSLVIDQICSDYERYEPDLELRQLALAECLKKLPVKQLDLVRRRYSDGVTPAEIAEQTNRPIQTVYTQFARLRQALLACIQIRMRDQGAGL